MFSPPKLDASLKIVISSVTFDGPLAAPAREASRSFRSWDAGLAGSERSLRPSEILTYFFTTSTGFWGDPPVAKGALRTDGRSARPRPQSKQVPPSVPETAGYQVPSYSTAAPAMLQRAAIAALHTLYWVLIPAKALSCSRPRTWLSELLRFAAHVHRGQRLS